jgi:hypothetical protein
VIRAGGTATLLIAIGIVACVGSDATPNGDTTIVINQEGGASSSSSSSSSSSGGGDSGSTVITPSGVDDCDPTKEFSAVVPIGPFNKGAFETSPVADDLATQVFYASTALEMGDTTPQPSQLDILSFTRRSNGTTTIPTDNLTASLNAHGLADADPAVMPDGLELVYVEQTSPNSTTFAIRYAKRSSADVPFGPPTTMSYGKTVAPTQPRGLSLVPMGDGAQLFYADFNTANGYEVLSASSVGPLSNATLGSFVGEVLKPAGGLGSSAILADSVAVSRDGLVMYASIIQSARTDRDIARFTRPQNTGAWTSSEIVAAINSPADDRPRWISPRGCTLFFSSQRNNIEQMFYAHRQ